MFVFLVRDVTLICLIHWVEEGKVIRKRVAARKSGQKEDDASHQRYLLSTRKKLVIRTYDGTSTFGPDLLVRKTAQVAAFAGSSPVVYLYLHHSPPQLQSGCGVIFWCGIFHSLTCRLFRSATAFYRCSDKEDLYKKYCLALHTLQKNPSSK